MTSLAYPELFDVSESWINLAEITRNFVVIIVPADGLAPLGRKLW